MSTIEEKLQQYREEPGPLPTPCWIWTRGTHKGYGRLRWQGKSRRVHRLSYEFHIGPIPKWQSVRHKCDNPSCINPLHLELGTQKDNIDDMVRRGRETYAGQGSSKFRGVARHNNKWHVSLSHAGISYKVSLGYFTTEIEAARAYNDYVIQHKLNRPLNQLPEPKLLRRPIRRR